MKPKKEKEKRQEKDAKEKILRGEGKKKRAGQNNYKFWSGRKEAKKTSEY